MIKNINYPINMFDLNNKVALVIGGGGYLCSEIARGYACSGANVVILDIKIKKARSVADEIYLETNRKPSYFSVDVSNKFSLQEALDNISNIHKSIDIVVNGAGINDPTPFLEIELNQWQEVMDSQITGTMLSCQVFGRKMLTQGFGSIINISSASAGPPLSKAFAYSVAKAGIKNLTMNLAREWGTKGVRVNAIRPGFFPTEWNRKNFITKEREKNILRHTPMGRYGSPQELVGAAIWLGSNASSFVTGAEIKIDGGFSCMTI